MNNQIQLILVTVAAICLGAILLMSCSKQIGSKLLKWLDEKNSSVYSGRHHRWVFADETNQEELDLKKQTLNKIDTFWAAFNIDKDELVPDNNPEYPTFALNWVADNLKPIDGNISWEIGPGSEGNPAIFTITAESYRELRPVITTLIEKAPVFDNWKFQKYREALPAGIVNQALESKGVAPIPNFNATCEVEEGNKIDITISSANFKSENAMGDLGSAFLLIEAVLGEENLEKWVGIVQTKPSETGTETSQAASNLAKTFEDKKVEILNSLPDDYYFNQEQPESSTVLQINTVNSTGRITIVCGDPELSKQFFNKGFYSERFSRNGEKFCFIKIDNQEAKTFSLDKANEFEDLVDEELRKAKLGCVVSSGKGTKEIFLDLCLTDVLQSKALISRLCDEAGWPHTAWIYFYDCEWVNEWIGLFPDTPAEEIEKRLHI